MVNAFATFIEQLFLRFTINKRGLTNKPQQLTSKPILQDNPREITRERDQRIAS